MNDLSSIAKYIDFTNLRNNLYLGELDNFCKEAIEYNFFGVCVLPYYVPYVVSLLKNSSTRIISVADFPYGCSLLKTKIDFVEELVKNKLDELDFVMNVAAFINKDYKLVEEEVTSALEICRGNNVKLKVIIETGLLLPDEIAIATRLLCDIGVDFIKTSTGVAARGVKYEDVMIIKENLSGSTKIKASGGIRTLEQVMKFLELGVSRIGTSAGVEILKELEARLNTE
ncbi:MAG: deoxyribose-phosphate aldolase [Ignavibacteria bacterium]|nr:deoxyribose-phosphate aldolase [Ignavibacteria bacterium]